VGFAALDVLRIEPLVKSDGRVETLKSFVCLFLETATPGFLRHITFPVFFTLSLALTPEGSPLHPLDTAAMDLLDYVENNSNRRMSNREYRMSK
jgi:hypothetical protein